MPSKKIEQQRALTEKSLRRYQKFCVYAIIPALLNFFAVAIGLFANKTINGAFEFGLTKLIDPHFEQIPALALLPAAGIAGVFVACGLLGAKGKEWCPFTMVGLYVADCVIEGIVFGNTVTGGTMGPELVLSLVFHLLFLGIDGALLYFYFQVKRRLKQEKAAS